MKRRLPALFLALLLTLSACTVSPPAKSPEPSNSAAPTISVSSQPVKPSASPSPSPSAKTAHASVTFDPAEFLSTPKPSEKSIPTSVPANGLLTPEEAYAVLTGQATASPTPSEEPTPTSEPEPSPEEPQSVTVYITDTGSKYHSDGCQYLRKSQIAISLDDAKSSGYSACSKCHPPR